MAKKSRSRKSRAVRIPRTLASLSGAPPAFSPDDLVSVKLRYFVTTNASNVPISRKNILNCLVFGVGANTAYRMFSSVRICEVRCWSGATPVASGVNVAISTLQWAGESSRPKTISAESMGVGTVAHFTSRPPKNSLAANWCNDNYLESDTILTLDVTQNDIWELDVVACLQNGTTAQFTANSVTTSSTLATGKVYCPTLDHDSNTFMTPIGRLGLL